MFVLNKITNTPDQNRCCYFKTRTCVIEIIVCCLSELTIRINNACVHLKQTDTPYWNKYLCKTKCHSSSPYTCLLDTTDPRYKKLCVCLKQVTHLSKINVCASKSSQSLSESMCLLDKTDIPYEHICVALKAYNPYTNKWCCLTHRHSLYKSMRLCKHTCTPYKNVVCYVTQLTPLSQINGCFNKGAVFLQSSVFVPLHGQGGGGWQRPPSVHEQGGVVGVLECQSVGCRQRPPTHTPTPLHVQGGGTGQPHLLCPEGLFGQGFDWSSPNPPTHPLACAGGGTG